MKNLKKAEVMFPVLSQTELFSIFEKHNLVQGLTEAQLSAFYTDMEWILVHTFQTLSTNPLTSKTHLQRWVADYIILGKTLTYPEYVVFTTLLKSDVPLTNKEVKEIMEKNKEKYCMATIANCTNTLSKTMKIIKRRKRKLKAMGPPPREFYVPADIRAEYKRLHEQT